MGRNRHADMQQCELLRKKANSYGLHIYDKMAKYVCKRLVSVLRKFITMLL